MQVHIEDRGLEVVTKKSELLEGVGLIPLLAIPFVLAGSWIGLLLFAVTIFGAVVIHSALRNA